MSNDPVQSLSIVVKLAEERREMGNMLMRVREISESDKKTLERVLSERSYVVALLDQFFKGRFEGKHNPYKEPFEYQYQRTFKGAMQHVFTAAGLKMETDQEEDKEG